MTPNYGVNHPLPSVAFAPMGGVKQSSLGRDGAHQGLEEFTLTKYVSVGS
jgi:succinate-semialdehyde dehydrogenase/glutarate-semialdehyde dehydrogenase